MARRFRRSEHTSGLTVAAVERARAFQRRTFGDRVLSTSSAELIEEDRREGSERLRRLRRVGNDTGESNPAY